MEHVEQTSTLLGKVEVRRCAEGERLYQEWLKALETHLPSIIYAAMQAYFCHKNGHLEHDGEVWVVGCRQCGFMTKEN